MHEQINTFRPDNLKLDNGLPTVCVVGAGLSGLLTAIQIKEKGVPIEVVVLDKLHSETNTQISGMRIRAKRAGSSAMLPEERSAEVTELLARQNNGVVTAPMKEFGQLLTEELTKWNRKLSLFNPELVHEISEWFGPQWGQLNQSGAGGRGLSVLSWLKTIASEQGVKFLISETTALLKTGKTITAVELAHADSAYTFRPDTIILANGNAAGRLFLSTNRSIKNSATELLFNAGLPLEGGSLIMWHPFGNCRSDGSVLLGCHETDALEKTKVFYMDGTEDQETTQLLQEHQAHYHFREIAKRFLEKGGVVQLVNPNGERQFARVSLHYSHLGAPTIDGTRVEGVSNLAVTGDAGGLLHWTNHKIRLPGFALAHCIVSARKASDWIASRIEGDNWVILEDSMRMSKDTQRSHAIMGTPLNEIRETNTKHVLKLEFGASDLRPNEIQSWTAELAQAGENTLKPLSLAIIDSWTRIVQGEHEPILLKNETTNAIVREVNNEPTREAHALSRRL